MVFVRVKNRSFRGGVRTGGRGLKSSAGAWMGDPVCRVEPGRQEGSVGRPAKSFPINAVVGVAGHVVGCGRSVGQVSSVGHWWYVGYRGGPQSGEKGSRQ